MSLAVRSDWGFSDQVHNQIMVREFYNKKNMVTYKASKSDDCDNSIDYWAVVDNPGSRFHGRHYSFQERFRKKSRFTEDSLEFTLRYKRSESLSDRQKQSEFFKMKADFLLYGIVDGDRVSGETEMLRYCVISLKNLKKAINKGLILIDESGTRKKPYIRDNKPVGVVIKNHEKTKGNSSFLVFDAQHIMALMPPSMRIVAYHHGYTLSSVTKHTYYGVKSRRSGLYDRRGNTTQRQMARF